ncbi:sulfatase [Gracilibacillus sp. YIM 98692]|uniref:sulfatase n=1 Tax=Gracilibacillus sp. YIM 98692 TaxID=2663532 RepID=UPI0013D2695C|nr:sulfatase [Gracilibacillus sp. YIM 98692]
MKAIVILLDTLNRHMLETYNDQAWTKTPNISRLAKKSFVFDNHWAGSLPCMPARRDFMTGRMDFLERGWGGLEPFDITLTKQLREKVIFSHIVTDHYHYFSTGGENYCQSFHTWDFHRGQEGDPWVSKVQSPDLPDEFLGRALDQHEKNQSKFLEEKDYPGPKTIQAACNWLKENESADDYFLMVEAFDPHEPFDCPDDYLDLYQDQYEGPRFNWPKYSKVNEPPEAMDHIQKRYAATLTMIDHWLGKLLDEMDRQNLWDDTLVLFTTDHGLLLGEHEWTGKNIMHVYNEIAHLPLMVHVPKEEGNGEHISAITQNIDLMPTILDYFNVPIPSKVQGNSLLKLIERKKEKIRDYALYGMFGMTVNITDGKYTYLRAPAREDNYPCHVYTAMPTTFRSFHGQRLIEQIEMGRFLDHTNYPVFKFPYSVKGESFQMAAHIKENHLFDIEADYEQRNPIKDEELENRYAEKLIQAMSELKAPKEQFTRLGLVNISERSDRNE